MGTETYEGLLDLLTEHPEFFTEECPADIDQLIAGYGRTLWKIWEEAADDMEYWESVGFTVESFSKLLRKHGTMSKVAAALAVNPTHLQKWLRAKGQTVVKGYSDFELAKVLKECGSINAAANYLGLHSRSLAEMLTKRGLHPAQVKAGC